MFEGQLKCYDSPECYFRSLPAELKLKRDYMMNFLRLAGLKPILPQGGFFLVADWSPLGKNFNEILHPKKLINSKKKKKYCREKNRFVQRNRRTKRLSLHEVDNKKYWCSWNSTISFL